MCMCAKYARVSRVLTSIIGILSILLQRKYKQRFWNIPEVALEGNLRTDAFELVAMTNSEKRRNGMYAVCGPERK
jgi:hypothetical protein